MKRMDFIGNGLNIKNTCGKLFKVLALALGLFSTSATVNAQTTDNDDVIPGLSQFSIPEFFFMTSDWDLGDFKGDIKALSRVINDNLKYPETAYENHIEGNVMIEFSVSAEGNIENIKIGESVNPILAQEVIRCVKLTSGMWGTNNSSNEPTYKLSIDFEL